MTAGANDRDNRLDELIAAYLQAVEAGEQPDRAELLARFPDLAEPLRTFFADFDRIDRETAPLRASAAVASVPTEAMPQQFGDYELLEEIGRGGMGIVYKARQVSLNRVVALKRIRAGQLASPEEVARFRREAEAAAGLDHPNIVPILDVGEHEGQHFFTMKLIEAGNLGGHLDKFADAKACADLMIKIARAVHHAHQRGILHRDLKPSNILIDADGNPHVSDFGLAQPIEKESKLTQSGAIVGTAEYMAPEQARGEKGLTTAADVYGLGAILYVLLTGRPPFQGDYKWETLKKVVEEEPISPRSLNRKANRDLEAICLLCLEKLPSDRYDSADELADDLQNWLEGKPILPRRETVRERLWKWAKRRPAATLLYFVLLALAAQGVVLFFEYRERTSLSTVAETQTKLAAAQEKLAREREWFLLLNQAQAERQRGNRWLSLERLAKMAELSSQFPDLGDRQLLRDEAFASINTPGVRLLREIRFSAERKINQFNPDGSWLILQGRNNADANGQRRGIWAYPLPDGPADYLLDSLGIEPLVTFLAGSPPLFKFNYWRGSRAAAWFHLWDPVTKQSVGPNPTENILASPDGEWQGFLKQYWRSGHRDQAKSLPGIVVEFISNDLLLLLVTGEMNSSGYQLWSREVGKTIAQWPWALRLADTYLLLEHENRLEGGNRPMVCWNAATGKIVCEPEGAFRAVLSQDTAMFGADIWNFRTGKKVWEGPAHLRNGGVTFSKDRSTAVFHSYYVTPKIWEIWDLRQNRLVAKPDVNDQMGVKEDALLSPDGRWFVYESNSQPGPILVHDRNDPERPFSLGGERDTLTPIALNPAHPILAVWRNHDCRLIELWDLEQRKKLVAIDNPYFPRGLGDVGGGLSRKQAIIWSPDGNRLLAKALSSLTVVSESFRVWELCYPNPVFVHGKTAHPLEYLPEALVRSLEFSPNGYQLAVNTDVWEVLHSPQGASLGRPRKANDAAATFFGTSGQVWQAYIPQPMLKEDQHGLLWRFILSKGTLEPIKIVQVSPQGREWVLPRPECRLTRPPRAGWPWSAADATALIGIVTPAHATNSLCWSLPPLLLYLGPRIPERIPIAAEHCSGALSVQRFGISPDGKHACVLYETPNPFWLPSRVSQLEVWSLEGDKPRNVWTLPFCDPEGPIPFDKRNYCLVNTMFENLGLKVPWDVMFHPDQKHFMLTPGWDAYHTQGLERVYHLETPPDGKKTAPGSPIFPADHVVKVHGKDGKELTVAIPPKQVVECKGHNGRMMKLAAFHLRKFRPGYSGQEGFVYLMDLASGQELWRWKAHEQELTALALSPDGRTLVTAGREGVVKVWNLEHIRRELNPLGLGW